MRKELIKKALGDSQTPKDLWKAKVIGQLRAIHKGIQK